MLNLPEVRMTFVGHIGCTIVGHPLKGIKWDIPRRSYILYWVDGVRGPMGRRYISIKFANYALYIL